jgi:hypothetical protein
MADQKNPFENFPPEVQALLNSLTVTRSPAYRTIFSNVFRTRLGAGEVTLIFSRLAHRPSIAAAVDSIEEEVEIVMSWPQLKMFIKTLQGVVEAIDSEVGEIKVPANFQSNLDANAASQRQAVRLVYGETAKK